MRSLAETQGHGVNPSELEGFSLASGLEKHEYPQYEYDAHHEEHFGVHIEFSDLFGAFAFLSAVYASGLFCSRVMGMPSLVGEILVGIIMGPNLLDIVPIEEAFVLLGEIGLILLVLEAGIDIDLTTLKLIGVRGSLIAVVGSTLPVAIAICVAYALGYQGFTAIAAGCAFTPTSLGIAMNVLRRAGIVNTPTGQMIVAAAIIDDMIALVVLSQLRAFTAAEPSVVDMVIPFASALGFLLIGGALAVFVVPKVLDKYIFKPAAKFTRFDPDWLAMGLMLSFLLALVPLTYFAKASPLMGAFLAGLCFCSNDGAHHMFVSQFKRLMQWLLRIFFAASIGFQVPILEFASGKVIYEGLAFTSALLGKLLVGFMVPNFGSSHRFRYTHLRDCLMVGFSMMAEGEFAFLIAVFGVSNNLLSKDLYSSIVLAILASTIIAPFLLQQTLSYYNKRIKHDILGDDSQAPLTAEMLQQNKVMFWRIQIKSAPAWGLQTKIVEDLTKLNLDLIDHRSWHPRRSHDTLLNEIYAKDASMDLSSLSEVEATKKMKKRVKFIKSELLEGIGQESALIQIQRWVPHIEYSDETERRDASEHVANIARSALEHSIRRDANEDIAHLVNSTLRASMQKTTSRTFSGDESDTESVTELSEQHPSMRFSRLYRGQLEGLFRQGSSGRRAPSSNRSIGYGGYDSDENIDHHGRTVTPRKEPSGRRVDQDARDFDMQEEDEEEAIEVCFDRV